MFIVDVTADRSSRIKSPVCRVILSAQAQKLDVLSQSQQMQTNKQQHEVAVVKTWQSISILEMQHLVMSMGSD